MLREMKIPKNCCQTLTFEIFSLHLVHARFFFKYANIKPPNPHNGLFKLVSFQMRKMGHRNYKVFSEVYKVGKTQKDISLGS